MAALLQVNVLKNIIDRLPLLQKVQVLTVNELWFKAAVSSLSTHDQLAVVWSDDLYFNAYFHWSEKYKYWVESRHNNGNLILLSKLDNNSAKWLFSHLNQLRVLSLDTHEGSEWIFEVVKETIPGLQHLSLWPVNHELIMNMKKPLKNFHCFRCTLSNFKNIVENSVDETGRQTLERFQVTALHAIPDTILQNHLFGQEADEFLRSLPLGFKELYESGDGMTMDVDWSPILESPAVASLEVLEVGRLSNLSWRSSFSAPRLRRLWIKELGSESKWLFRSLRTCSLLTDLRISEVANLEEIHLMFQDLHSLKRVNLPKTTDRDLIALFENNPNLEMFETSGGSELTDATLVSLATLSQIQSVILDVAENFDFTNKQLITFLRERMTGSRQPLHVNVNQDDIQISPELDVEMRQSMDSDITHLYLENRFIPYQTIVISAEDSDDSDGSTIDVNH